jgi:hypothetical protein
VLDGEIIGRIAEVYDQLPGGELETRLFSDEFRQPILKRGFLLQGEIEEIAAWKSRLALHWVVNDDEGPVQSVTRLAFGMAEPELAAHILGHLKGVRVRMASAILTVYDPFRFTVLDRRAWATLKWLGSLGLGGWSTLAPLEHPDGSSHLDCCATYGVYLRECRALAELAGVPLRALDKFLWTVDKLGLEKLKARGIHVAAVLVTPAAASP